MQPDLLRSFFDALSPKYDAMNTLLSFGLNKLWMKRLARSILEARPRRHLDLCCGTGAVIAHMERLCPAARLPSIDCVDFSPAMTALAKKRLINARIFLADAAALPFEEGSYDTISIAYGLRNIVDKGAVLSEAARVLRPGGRLYILELTKPCAFIRPFHSLYLSIAAPFLGALITGQSEPYQYLSRSIQAFSVEDCLEKLRLHGFLPQKPKAVSLGLVTFITAEKGT